MTPRLKEEKEILRSVIHITEERQKLFLFFEINFFLAYSCFTTLC